MTLKDFELKKGNHFVAMEYYGLIFNRTFLVLLTNEYLICLKVNGLVSVQSGGDPFAIAVTRSLAINDDIQNPYSYIKGKFIRKIENLDLFGKNIMDASIANFKINRIDITDTYYDKRKKWGMGPYPHDEKVYIKTKDGKKREFIILGNQSGKEIEKWIKTFPNSI